jgi:hypothetical protein
MPKLPKMPRLRPYLLAFLVTAASACISSAPAQESPSYADIADARVATAQGEVRRMQVLVQEGALPPKRLEEAEAALADVQDDSVLAGTLYGGTRVQDLSTERAAQMVAAAERRLQRQEALVESKRAMIESGIIARNEAQPPMDELEMRKRTLQLAQDRAKLLNDLLAMARAEQLLEQSRSASLSNVMVRYEGTSVFSFTAFQGVSAAYAKHFRQDLPVSALGQTLVHQELGFDHRGRVDVAVNPDTPEGLWLRRFLERQHIPYVAFRAAVSGSATGPHIHIGPGSLRVRIPPPPDAPVRSVARSYAASAGS